MDISEEYTGEDSYILVTPHGVYKVVEGEHYAIIDVIEEDEGYDVLDMWGED